MTTSTNEGGSPGQCVLIPDERGHFHRIRCMTQRKGSSSSNKPLFVHIARPPLPPPCFAKGAHIVALGNTLSRGEGDSTLAPKRRAREHCAIRRSGDQGPRRPSPGARPATARGRNARNWGAAGGDASRGSCRSRATPGLAPRAPPPRTARPTRERGARPRPRLRGRRAGGLRRHGGQRLDLRAGPAEPPGAQARSDNQALGESPHNIDFKRCCPCSSPRLSQRHRQRSDALECIPLLSARSRRDAATTIRRSQRNTQAEVRAITNPAHWQKHMAACPKAHRLPNRRVTPTLGCAFLAGAHRDATREVFQGMLLEKGPRGHQAFSKFAHLFQYAECCGSRLQTVSPSFLHGLKRLKTE